MPKRPLDPEVLQQEIETYLSPEARRWLADVLHDYLGGRITNSSLQAEIVLRAWEKRPDMALSEMQALKEKLDEASAFLVEMVRRVTPPANPDA
jgi:glucose-6-phosphate-specific signal transduction histidine kinase